MGLLGYLTTETAELVSVGRVAFREVVPAMAQCVEDFRRAHPEVRKQSALQMERTSRVPWCCNVLSCYVRSFKNGPNDPLVVLRLPLLLLQVGVLIGVGHAGYLEDQQVAARVPGLDLIVGGHSHSFLWEDGRPDTAPEKGELGLGCWGIGHGEWGPQFDGGHGLGLVPPTPRAVQANPHSTFNRLVLHTLSGLPAARSHLINCAPAPPHTASTSCAVRNDTRSRDVPEGPYPTLVSGPGGRTVPVVQASCFSRCVALPVAGTVGRVHHIEGTAITASAASHWPCRHADDPPFLVPQRLPVRSGFAWRCRSRPAYLHDRASCSFERAPNHLLARGPHSINPQVRRRLQRHLQQQGEDTVAPLPRPDPHKVVQRLRPSLEAAPLLTRPCRAAAGTRPFTSTTHLVTRSILPEQNLTLPSPHRLTHMINPPPMLPPG